MSHTLSLDESIKELQLTNKKIAKLTMRKEELTQSIIAALGHEKEGQKTYEYDEWKITAKTPYIFSLDKKAYEKGDVYLPCEFDPIKKSTSYTVDKKLFEQYMGSAPIEVRQALGELVTIKPGKPGVSIESRG